MTSGDFMKNLALARYELAMKELELREVKAEFFLAFHFKTTVSETDAKVTIEERVMELEREIIKLRYEMEARTILNNTHLYR